MARQMDVDEQLREVMERFNDVLIEIDVAEEALEKLKAERDRLDDRLVTSMKSRGFKSVNVDGLGRFEVSATTHFRVADREAFDAWWKERGLSWDLFHMISAQKLNSYCRAQDQGGEEIPRGVETYDKERIKLVGRKKGAGARGDA